jgi:hypothetical protein
MKFELKAKDLMMVTPSRIVNARGNVTLPLESPPSGGDLNRQRCKIMKQENDKDREFIRQFSQELMNAKEAMDECLFYEDLHSSMESFSIVPFAQIEVKQNNNNNNNDDDDAKTK